jgi:SAM-dependent methyltransferase
MLQSTEFTEANPLEPASVNQQDRLVTKRVEDLLKAVKQPATERLKYFATLLPDTDAPAFLQKELSRVLLWIRDKEVGCRSAPSPQACVADLYTSRGHSSDTSPQSLPVVRAAFAWLSKVQHPDPKRVLIIGPGSDFAPRTDFRSGTVQTYQPRLVRELAKGATVDCVDINPRVVSASRNECHSSERLDITVESSDRRYDLIIATNLLLYLNDAELLLALQNVKRMLGPGGVFVHNDGRFQAGLFGKAVGLPLRFFEKVTLDATRHPALIDHLVIHELTAPRL